MSICTVWAQPGGPTESYAHAESLIREHHWDEGLAVLASLGKMTGQSPKSLNLAGLAYVGKGDRVEAARQFEQALQLNSGFTPALKNLAIDEVAMGQPNEARRHLEAAEKIVPDDPVVNLYLGEILYQRHEFKEAAEHLRLAGPLVSREPNLVASLAISELKSGQGEFGLETVDSVPQDAVSPHTGLILGLALAERGFYSRAVSYLEAAALHSPASSDIRYDLALCYMSLKQYAAVIEALNLLVSQKQETSEVDNVLAQAYEATHQTQAAVDALRRAIALDPADEDNYLDFASLCIDHQSFEDAAKVLNVGLNEKPKSSRLIFERGILNAMQDRFDQAEKDFQLSADLAPESNSGYIGLGVTYLETGKSAEAVPVLRKRLREHPDDANLHYLLGEALLRSGAQLGQPTYLEAETNLQQAVRLNPGLAEPHVSLGTIYLQQEQFQQAVDELEQARRWNGKSKAAYSHLAVAYRHLGRQEKAKEVLAELKSMNDQERMGARGMVDVPVQQENSTPQPTGPK